MPIQFRLAALAVAMPIAAHAAAPGVLQVGVDQSPAGLDPHIATAFSSVLVDSAIYEGLTAIDAKLQVVPALAAAWMLAPDRKTYDFLLRPGAVFHDGTPVTAEAVIANIKRVTDPKTASPYASRFTSIASMTATGKDTLRIVLKEPSAPFLAQLATLAIASPAAFADLARKPDGTGPFAFKEWIPDTSIALVANPHYWAAGLPHLAGVTFDIVPDAATRQLGLASGTYEMLPNIDAATATALAGKPHVSLLKTQDLAYSLIGMNVSQPPFNNPKVREALNMGLDREQIVQAAYFGRGVPGGPLSPALATWALPTTAFACYRPDSAGAKKLLAEAGVKGRLPVTLKVLGSVQQVVDVAQVAQAQLNKAGFDVKLDVQTLPAFVKDWRASNFEGFVSLNGGGVDPDDYFGRTYQTSGATNVFKYSNPGVDKLLNEARSEANLTKRKAEYDTVQRDLACDGPIATLAYGTLFTAVRDNVHGFTPLATRSLWALRDVTLTK
jgi:peptide/nickel transport system substrate-binding protein